MNHVFTLMGAFVRGNWGPPKREPEGVENLVRERGNGKCVSLVVTTGLKMVPFSSG